MKAHLVIRCYQEWKIKDILQKFERKTKSTADGTKLKKSAGGFPSVIIFDTDAGQRLLITVSAFVRCMADYL